jgi:hypothetical protein
MDTREKDVVACPECGGRGHWQDQYEDGSWARSETVCSTCEGEGELPRDVYVTRKRGIIEDLRAAIVRHEKDLDDFGGGT